MDTIQLGIFRLPAKNLAQESHLRAPANRLARANGNRCHPPPPSGHGDAPTRLRPADLCCVGAQSFARADKWPGQGETLGGERVRAIGRTDRFHRHSIKPANVETALNVSDCARSEEHTSELQSL